MSQRHERLPVSALERVDDLCAQFEDSWQRGEQPSIEELVDLVTEPRERAALLAELLVLEFEHLKHHQINLLAKNFRFLEI